jgi:hypothetical protein
MSIPIKFHFQLEKFRKFHFQLESFGKHHCALADADKTLSKGAEHFQVKNER